MFFLFCYIYFFYLQLLSEATLCDVKARPVTPPPMKAEQF